MKSRGINVKGLEQCKDCWGVETDSGRWMYFKRGMRVFMCIRMTYGRDMGRQKTPERHVVTCLVQKGSESSL